MKYGRLMAMGVALAVGLGAGSAMAGDATKGEKVFKKCVACHSIEQGGKHKVGPNLFGVVGRAAGAAEGFKYSGGMVDAMAAGAFNWAPEEIFTYLADPNAYLSAKAGKEVKSKMTFKLKEEEARHDVIEYLSAQK